MFGRSSDFSVGSVRGFRTILPHDVNSFFCGLCSFQWMNTSCFFFFSLAHYFQYHITHGDSTCCFISWGQVSKPAVSFQKSPFAPLLIDGNWQLHLFPDESLILHNQESAKKMPDGFGLFTMSALKNKRE